MRLGVKVILVTSQTKAMQALRIQEFDLIVLDLVLENGSAFAISDFANYRRPAPTPAFFLTARFFSIARMPAHTFKAPQRRKISQ